MEVTPVIAYLAGFIGGDGNLSERRTALIDKSLEFHENVIRKIMNSSQEIFSEYIKGWMDAEGWVTTKKTVRKSKTYVYPKVAFNVADKSIRDELVDMLKRIGIDSSIWKSGNMFGFQIIGFEKVSRYKELVGFEHPDKIRKLNILLA